jgi:probable rRNA maturation factor
VNIDLITVKNLKPLPLLNSYRLLMKKTLQRVGFSLDTHVDVWITNNQTIQRYNQKYRQKNQATDVLSFSFIEDGVTLKQSPIHLGQIIISYQQAFKQARTYGHSQHRELNFLFVHGLLHLLGYNHETEAQEKMMFALQDAILGKRVVHG